MRKLIIIGTSGHGRVVAGTFVGAGATVIKDIATSGTYVGVPARLVE